MQDSSQAAVMTFLNEVASEFPKAISLAAGRPTDLLFERLDHAALLQAFVDYDTYFAKRTTGIASLARLLQYGRTAGIINDLFVQQIQNDENVSASADRVVITAGCQEAIVLCLAELCPQSTDVALVCNPTYIGAAGAAQSTRVALHPLSPTEPDLAAAIEDSVIQLHRQGRRARALYLIPDFDNPTGRVLDESQRRAALAVCIRHRVVVLEDNPYGMFRYEGCSVPPMAALDDAGSVIYLSTYSKTLSPALRVGAVTLPETLFGDRPAREALHRALVQRKSFITVNTSQITQAIVGGLLLNQQCSLRSWVQPSLVRYRNNRDAMLAQLQVTFAQRPGAIRWNHPNGGFFLTLDLPFCVDAEEAIRCATNYGVIIMPMAFFASDRSQDQRIRLAFSGADETQIRDGIVALGRYIFDKI